MRVGRARDQERIDARVGERGLRVGDGGARGRRDGGGGCSVDVDDVLQAGARMRGDVRRMDAADAAGAEERESLHACRLPPSRAVSWYA